MGQEEENKEVKEERESELGLKKKARERRERMDER